MQPYHQRQVMTILKKNGWYVKRFAGSHIIFKHDTYKHIITVPSHAKHMSVPLVQRIIRESSKEILSYA
jgi:predicted RNA binding protein YcfA (HicA-like mRNA interferase family)